MDTPTPPRESAFTRHLHAEADAADAAREHALHPDAAPVAAPEAGGEPGAHETEAVTSPVDIEEIDAGLEPTPVADIKTKEPLTSTAMAERLNSHDAAPANPLYAGKALLNRLFDPMAPGAEADYNDEVMKLAETGATEDQEATDIAA